MPVARGIDVDYIERGEAKIDVTAAGHDDAVCRLLENNHDAL